MPRKPHKTIHVTTARHPLSRKTDDIGPAYRFIGVSGIVVLLGLFVLERLQSHAFSKFDVMAYGIGFAVCLTLIRPRVLDGLVKGVANRLPFVRFQQPDSGD